MSLLPLFAALLAMAAAPAALALDSVVLQLNWKHQFQFAGYYAAIEMGYYRAAGLEVTLAEAEETRDPVAAVLEGKAQFGVAASELALLRGQGKPVVALATILQHSPLAVLARRASGIDTLHDLVGKRIMLMPHEAELFAYLRQEGVPLDKLIQLPHSFNPEDLIQGRVDAVSGYVTDEPFLLQQAGTQYSRFTPRASGIDFYGDTLFTAEQELKAHPDRARAFREASLRGWQYAMLHPDEIADLILARYAKRHSRPHLLFEAAEMRRLMQPELIEIGHMNPGRWRRIAETYAELGMLPADFSLDGFLYDPSPRRDLGWLYRGLAGGLLLTVIIFRYFWLSRMLRKSEERFRMLADISTDVFFQHDMNQCVTYVSEGERKLLGYPPEEIIGKSIKEILTPASYQHIIEKSARLMELERHGKPMGTATYEVEQHRKDGGTLWLEMSSTPLRNAQGRIVGFFGIARDMSERKRQETALREANAQLEERISQIQSLQAELHEQAMRDPLTGLYNRRYLDETLERELARARRESYPLCLLLIDLDHFKKVNDTYGHQAGDEVLKMFSALLRDSARAEDIPCRYGGEEFLLLLPKMPLEIANQRAEQLRREFATRIIDVGEHHIRETISVGIAAYPDHGTLPDDLTQNADKALYSAKQGGRNRVAVFSVH